MAAKAKSKIDEQKMMEQAMARVLSSALRPRIAGRLGKSGYTDRELYTELGYVESLTYANHYYPAFRRNPIANAVITRPVDESWRLPPTIDENIAGESTLEKEWGSLSDRLQLSNRFKRVDRLATLGQWALMLIGFKDGSMNLSEPVGAAQDVLYVTPYPESSATIEAYETDTQNARYGLPNIYKLSVRMGTTTTTHLVHWSRVIHVVQDNDVSDIEGNPALECVYNFVTDLEKVVGGAGEMFWRGAMPWMKLLINDQGLITDTVKSEMKDKIESLVHGLRRYLMLQNMDMQQISPQVADPSNHVSAILDVISAGTRIPKRILVGSERGELASTQDRESWAEQIGTRRESYCETQIVRPFIDRCIQYGVLPEPKEGTYDVDWPDLMSSSDKDLAEVAKLRAETVKVYADSAAAGDIMPSDIFFDKIMGFTQEEIEQINAARDTQRDEADNDDDLPPDPDGGPDVV